MVLLVTMPVAQTVLGAVVHGVVECCCGVHDVDHDCGCPDCPGGDHGRSPNTSPNTANDTPSGTPNGTPDADSDTGDGSRGHASFRACSSQGYLAVPAVFPDFLLPGAASTPIPARVRRGKADNHRLPLAPDLDRITAPPEIDC